jgi:hypothetical protein
MLNIYLKNKKHQGWYCIRAGFFFSILRARWTGHHPHSEDLAKLGYKSQRKEEKNWNHAKNYLASKAGDFRKESSKVWRVWAIFPIKYPWNE